MAEIKEDDVLLDIIDFVDISISPEEYNAVRAMYNSIYAVSYTHLTLPTTERV